MAGGVVIKVRDDGPLKVTGPVTVVDVDGESFDLGAGDSVVLCRCGASRSKPFCDGSHKEIGFASRTRARAGSATLPADMRSKE